MITKTILHFFLRSVINISCLKVLVSFLSTPLLEIDELERFTGLERGKLIEVVEKLVLRGVLRKKEEKFELRGLGDNFLKIDSCKSCIGCVNSGLTIDKIIECYSKKRNMRDLTTFDKEKQIQLCIQLFGEEEARRKYGESRVEEIMKKMEREGGGVLIWY